MKTPLRPIRITFVLGKGPVRRRRESDDPTRFVVEQLLVEVLNDNWDDFKKDLAAQLRADVRMELNHLASEFKYHIVGISAGQKRPTGILTSAAKGDGRPEMSLSSAFGQDWIPRSAKYLREKKRFSGQTHWFDNTGADNGGFLRKQFTGAYLQGATTGATFGGAGGGSGGSFGPSGGIFEDLFGPVSVQIIKNKANWGLNPGGAVNNSLSKNAKVTIKLATVRVRALGSVTDSMLHVSNNFNSALISLIRQQEPELANRLGGRYYYRPTLEPFLQFFLQRALPHAVTQRIRNGKLGTSILRVRR